MILTQPETYALPRNLNRVFKRSLTNLKASTKKYARSKIRRARSYAIASVKNQYFLSRAYADFIRYSRSNEDIFITSIIVAAVMAYAGLTTFGQFLILFLNNGYAISEQYGASLLPLLLAALGVLGMLYLWATAFVVNMMSIAVMEGATGKTRRSLRSTARRGLRLASRVSAVWLSLVSLIVGPLLAAAVGLVVFIQFHPMDEQALLALAPWAIVAALGWVLTVIMNFSLAPYVALFEDTTVKNSFIRSYRLVKTRGRIFLMLGHCLLAIALAVAYAISVMTEKVLMLNKWVAFSCLALIVALTANGLMVSLYRKRRLARK